MKPNNQRQNKLSILFVIMLIAGLLALAGCGAGNPETNAVPAAPPTQTSVQLAWVHNIEFIGFYAAVKEGYYTDENLEVTLLGSGYDDTGAYIDPVQVVTSGKADFGVAGTDVLLQARAQGKPVVGVASMFQRNPVVLISLKEKNIVRPQDLLGKRVMVAPPETTVGITYNAFIASKNLDQAQINEIPRVGFTVDPLFNDETDVLQGYITNEVVQAQLQGEVNLILMSDYDIDIYSNAIFTTEDMIKNKPEIVEAMVRATTRGMQWAVDNPEGAAQYVVDTYGEGMDQSVKDAQEPGMKASLPLLNPARSKPGMMTTGVWENSHQILLDQGILSEPLDIDAAYTLTFLKKIYN